MLEERYKKVQEIIKDTCKLADRNEDTVTLVAVSKFHTANSIASLALLGHKDFAESYFKEAKDKIPQVEEILSKTAPDLFQTLQWHSIGHIQIKQKKLARVIIMFMQLILCD